nr:hypothetical protein HK105_000551 [Polyrhizophydium stewartii]
MVSPHTCQPLAAAAPAAAANQRRLHRIDIVRSAESVVLQSVSWFWKIVVGVLRLFGFKRLSNSVGIKRSILGREGLVGLNKVLLEGAQKDIRRIMDICADESSYPVIVHCSAGKDRTGLTIALLQLLAGVPDDVVVADYAISETLLSQRMGNLLVDVGRMGLGDQFAKSPPEVMVATIELIKTKYGGINAYLESIGVSKDQQRRICELLADKTGSNSTLTSSRL